MFLQTLGADGREILPMHRGDQPVSPYVVLETNSKDVDVEIPDAPRYRLVPEVHLRRRKLLGFCVWGLPL